MNNNEFLKAIGESGAKYILGLIKKNENSIKANTQLLTQVNEKADTAENIAKGRNQAHVFATTADMQTWLSNEENKGLYNVGDNLYIVAVDVPDWWIAEVLDEADAETGYYYKIAQLEVQKVDLSEYLKNTGDTKNNVTTFTSSDSTSPTAWTDVAALATGEKQSSIFNKVSTMFKNIRWLYKMLGTTDISAIGDGTATGAISALNNALVSNIKSFKHNCTNCDWNGLLWLSADETPSDFHRILFANTVSQDSVLYIPTLTSQRGVTIFRYSAEGIKLFTPDYEVDDGVTFTIYYV